MRLPSPRFQIPRILRFSRAVTLRGIVARGVIAIVVLAPVLTVVSFLIVSGADAAPGTNLGSRPGAPSITSVTAAPAQLTVNFSPPTLNAGNVTSYQVEYSTNGSSWTTFSSSISSSASSVAITGLALSTSYYVRIAANSIHGLGIYGYPWQKIYQVANPLRTSGDIQYSAGFGIGSGNASSTYASSSFTRIRYRMQAYTAVKYVDANFSKVLGTKTTYSETFDSLARLAVPSINASPHEIHGNISDLNIESNHDQVENGSGFNGRLELWPWDYGTAAWPELPARTFNTYDDSDSFTPGSGTYGSFQLHRIDDQTASNRTIFAWNDHTASHNSNPDIGFGNHASTHSDWTFTTTDNRANFGLEIYINPPTTTLADATKPTSSASITATHTTGTSVSVAYSASDAVALSSVNAYYSTSSSLSSPQNCGSATSLSGTSASGTITCTIPSTDATYYFFTRATDSSGNFEDAPGAADDSIIRDTVRPTATVAATSASAGSTVSVGITLSESSVNFATGDVTATGGTISNVSGSGTSYNVTFTPYTTSSGTGTVTVTAGSFSDAAGNTNASASSGNVTISNTLTASGGRSSFSGNPLTISGTSTGTKYIVERFTSSSNWTVPEGVNSLEVLVVGGGGGSSSRHFSGGGGGGFTQDSLTPLTAGSTYAVTVGAGGSPGIGSSSNGGSSSFLRSGVGISAAGGSAPTTWTPGGTSGNGFTGGAGLSNNCGTSDWCGGGGGGAAANGIAATTSGGGAGGAGRSTTISGATVFYGGGGGGGGGESLNANCSTFTSGGAGGVGGGGNGGTPGTNGTYGNGYNGTPNTGGGAGGGAFCAGTNAGEASGGSGIVVVRYALPATSAPVLKAADDTGIAADNITSKTTLNFSGSAPVGSIVQLSTAPRGTSTSGGTWTNTGSTCTADVSTGIWNCTTGTLASGDYAVRATAVTYLDSESVTQNSTLASDLTIDTTAPTVSSVSFTSDAGADNTYKIGDTISVTVSFSENVVVTGLPSVALAGLTNKSATYSSGSGTNSLVFTYPVTSGDLDADGLAIAADSLTLNSGTIRDASANNAILLHAAVATQSTHKVDAILPTISLSGCTASYVSGSTCSITIALSETTTDLTVDDFSVTRGSLSALTTSGLTRSITFTASGNASGTGTVSVAANKFTDTAGNNNTASNSLTINFSTSTTTLLSSTAPTGASVVDGTSGASKYIVRTFTDAGNATWTVPRGVTSVDYLVVGGGGGGGAHVGGGGGAGGVRTGTLTGLTSGSALSVVVGAGGAGATGGTHNCTDLNLRSKNGANSSLNSISSTGGGGGGSWEYCTGLSGGSGGGGGTTSNAGTGTSGQGTNGGGGNGGASGNYTGGGGGGASSAGGAGGASTGGSGGAGVSSSITGSSRFYGGGGGGGVHSSPGTAGLGGSSIGGAGTVFAYKVKAGNGAANTGSGGGGGGYPSGEASSSFGGDGGSGIVVIRYLVPAPTTPNLSDSSDVGVSPSDNITPSQTLTFTGTAAMGASVQLSYATATSTSDTSTSTGTWTNTGSACSADITTGAWSCDTDELSPGLYKFRSIAITQIDGVTDTQTSSSGLPVSIDTTSPTVTSIGFTSDAGTDNAYKAGDVIRVTVTMSEAATVTGIPRIALSGLTDKYATYTSGSGTTSLVFSYTVQAGDNDDDGLSITQDALELNSGTMTDAAGNNAAITHDAVASQSAHTVDTTAPTLTIVRSGTGTLKAGQTDIVTFTLSEASADFVRDDVTVSGGTLSALTGSGTTYTATFTPTASSSGDAQISVVANKFTDPAGNSNTASDTFSISYDTSAPTMSVTANPVSISSGETSTITFTASETTTTFDLQDVSATLGTLSNFSGSNRTYSATFTPSTSSGGTAVITVSANSFSDSAGNTNTAASTGNLTVTNTVSSTGGRSTYIANGTNGTNGTRYFVERFTTVGSTTWTPPKGVASVEYLIVGAGGAGGTAFVDASSGGGGGGEVVTGSISSPLSSSYTITVGAGGTAANTSPNPGGNGGGSSISTIATARGGGGGSSFTSGGYGTAPTTGYTGGGGGSWAESFSSGSTGSGGVTRKGGNGFGSNDANTQSGGGGGGANGSGVNGAASLGGAGGSGMASSLTGSTIRYGGGGGGGKRMSTGSAGTGTDGGGNGGVNAVGSTGLPNRGGGGGGAGSGTASNRAGGAGGSGIVVVRYSVPDVSTPDLITADDAGTTTDNITSKSILRFTGTAPVGSSVQLFADGTATGNTCPASSTTGEWECTTGVLTSGDKVITAESITLLPDSNVTSTSSGLTVTIDTTAPTVSTVSFTSNAGIDNTYKIGDTISVAVAFSENVVVTGSPTLPLVGLTNKSATYASGSGTSSLAFTYQVASGDLDADGLAIDADSLVLSSGTIRDSAVNDATLTHSAVTMQSAHKVDGVVPTVTNVTSSTSNSTIGIGATVSIQVTFSESVTVTGTPQLTLETGTTDRTANYTSGSGTSTLNFTYTVQSGDTSSDLDYASTTSLGLNNGTISDDAGNSATLALSAPGTTGSLGANKAIVVASEPTQIVSVREPVGTASGAAFTTQPQVSLQDSGASVVTTDNSTVVTATVSVGATLVGTRTATAVNGVVTFNNLGISGTAGTPYTITYSATVNGNSLTVVTQTVTPTIGAAVSIAITSQPVGDTAGALLSTQPIVKVLDSGDNVVTGSSIAVMASASGGTLGGTKVVNAINGVATFDSLTFAGTASTNYTLTFTTADLGSVTSDNFSVGVGAPTQIIRTTNASGAVYSEDFTTQPVLEIRDAGNNKVTAATNVVTATLSSGTIPGTTDTTLTATAVGGVATFSGLGITGMPGDYTITYSSGALTTASQSITLVKANQTITFTDPADRAWSTTAIEMSPTSTSGLTVTLTSTSTDVCTVAALDVTMVEVGICSLTASQAGNDYYNAASSVTQSFEISQASQSITFAAIANRSWSASTFNISPSATSGLAVSVISETTSFCTVSGTTVSMLKAGTCELTASQSGSTNYSAATSMTQSFEISLATQATLSIATLTATYEDDLTLATSGGSGDGAVTYVKVSGDCTLSGNTLTPTAAGSCEVTATKAEDTQYDSASVTSTITINKADQSVSLTLATASVVYGQTLTLSGSGGEGDGAITYSVGEGTCALNIEVLTPGNAGSVCKVRLTRAESANYNSLTSDPIVITVTRATPTLGTLALSTKTFGDAAFALTGPSATYNNASVAGAWSYSSAQTSVATIEDSTATITGGGTSVITATFSPTDSVNYNSANTASTLTVEKATPTFSWSNVTAIYGDADFTIVSPAVATTAATGTWSYVSATASVVAISGTKFDVGDAGSSVITATFTPSNTTNYVSGGTIAMTVTVERANQSALLISSTSGTYGTDLTLTTTGGTIDGTITWGVSNGTATDCAISSGELRTTSIGTCTVTATMEGNDNFNSVTNSGTIVTINAKLITISANTQTKTYGDNDPTLTITIPAGALVGQDTLTGTPTREAGETVGEYTINKGTVAHPNYNIAFTTAKLTIDQKPITLTAHPKTKTYGEPDPDLTFSIPDDALVGQDRLSGLPTRETGADVGQYTINQGSVANSNYNISFTTAKLTIEHRLITITADPKTKTYGEDDPTLTYRVTTGTLANSNDLTGSLSRDAGTTVGQYTINQGTVNNTNYTITYVSDELTIGQKPITLTAHPKTKIYGQDDPDLTFTTPAGSLVGNDQLTGLPNRVAGETVGDYTINRGSVANANYNISFTTAKLTIEHRLITITADPKTKTYGDNDPALTYRVTTGTLANSNDLTGSLTRETGNDAGEYTINQGTVNNSNYTISYVSDKLTIVQAPQSALSVTTTNITYRTPVVLQASGGSDGALSFAVATAGTASCSIDGLTLSATGNAGSTCTVTATRAETNNYLQKTSAAFTITVVPRAITLTAEADDKTYGDADPGFTFRVTTGSLFGSDTISGSQIRDTGENVGTYSINRGTLANPNYTILYVPADFTITQRPITITATNKTKIFGESDPALSYTVSAGNVVNADSFTGAITRAPGETLGTYNITRGTLANGNYNITFVVGIFRITGAQQQGFVLTASSYSVVYQDTVTLATTGGNGNGLVSFTAQAGTGSCSIAADVLTGETAGTCTVTAIKEAEGGYLEATSNVITITVDKAEQTITLAQMTDHDFTPTPMTVTPTTDSGSQVILESRTPNVCTTTSFEVQLKDSGTCTLVANVPESRNHNAAPTITRSFTVRAVVPFAPTITEVTPGNATISVDFVAGLSGGASITTYKYSINDGETWAQWPDGSITSPLVITNVPNSIESKVRIAAVNRVGTGARSNMKAATPKSPVWEVERRSNTALPTSVEATVTSLANMLPPRPALVSTKSVQGGRRTQVTAMRAARDVNIPVTHAIISVRLKNGRLLARIQVRVDPNNPTTSVTVPYTSSRVRISVQFANDIGVSAGGTAGVNLREGNTFLGTTINGLPRLAGTPLPRSVSFAKGSSTLSTSAKAALKKSLKTAQARGGLIYVTGYAATGETKSSWRLETLARKRAENVSKYLISLGARQWITFYGAPTAPTTWHTSRPGHVDIATVGLDQI